MIKLRIKESNNFLKENAITDIRQILNSLSNYDRNHLENWLKNSNVNIEDCKLVPIDKPKGYTTAKRSKFPFITLDRRNNVSWFGQDMFKTTDWEDKISNAFRDAVEVYQIVPEDFDTYQSRSDIQQNRRQGIFVDTDKYKPTDYRPIRHASRNYGRGFKVDAYTEYPRGTSETPKPGMKYMTFDELDLYNPNTNKKKYTKMLEETGLDVFIKRYNDICNKINELNELFKEFTLTDFGSFDNIDFEGENDYNRGWHSSNNKLDSYNKALREYSYVIQYLEEAHRAIKELQRYGANGYHDYYDEVKRNFKNIEEGIKTTEEYLERII